MKPLNHYYRKIKCLFGKHTWIYQIEPMTYITKTTKIESDIRTRFCTSCYQKEVRDRRDVHIHWYRTKLKLTPEQTRIKNLDIITNG